METQVVLSSAGMDLRNNSNVNVATFGTTTKFFDGVGHADANRKLQLNASGLIAFGDDTNTFAHVKSTGIQLVEDSTEVANFAATTTIGNTSTEHVEITSTTLKLKMVQPQDFLWTQVVSNRFCFRWYYFRWW